MPPAYNHQDFVSCCKTGKGNIVVPNRVVDDAARDFSLRSKKEILDFIGNGGLGNCKLDLCRPYEEWKGKGPAPMVDSYRFQSGPKFGYLAYYRGPDGAWILKSFKADKKAPTAQMPVPKSTELTFKAFGGLAKMLEQMKKPEEE